MKKFLFTLFSGLFIFASSYSQAHEITLLAEKFKTPVSVGYCLRYLPSAIKINELLKANSIGTIYNCNIDIGQYLPDWRPGKNHLDSVSASKALGGGVLLELSHELDYASWLLGPLHVESSILRTSSELNLDVEEIADLVLSTDKGTICNIHLDFLQKKPNRYCTFIGSEGRLDWDLIQNSILYSTKNQTKLIFSELNWDRNQMYLDMILDFMKLIKLGFSDSVDVKHAEYIVKLIDTIKSKSKWRQV